MWDIVEAIHKALKIEHTWQFVAVIAFGAALVAGFIAWIVDTGYKNTPEYKAEHKSQPLTLHSPGKDGLSLEFNSVAAGYESEQSKDVKFFITASVINHGPPSIADSWLLTLTTLDGKSRTEKASYIDPNAPIVLKTKFGTAEYSQRDALYEKTMQPIPTGDKKTGFLIFKFKGVTKEYAHEKGTVIELQCKDVSGNIVQQQYTIRSESEQPQYFPGTGPAKFNPEKHD